MFCTKCGQELVKQYGECYWSPYYKSDTGKKVRAYGVKLVCPKKGWKALWGHDEVFVGYTERSCAR